MKQKLDLYNIDILKYDFLKKMKYEMIYFEIYYWKKIIKIVVTLLKFLDQQQKGLM